MAKASKKKALEAVEPEIKEEVDVVFKGRPTIFNDFISDKICQGIMAKSSLQEVCKQEGMPHRSTVFVWLASSNPIYEDFQDRYARAYEIKLECIADDIFDIADNPRKIGITKDESGNEKTVFEDVKRSILRVDARKWILAKLKPKKYGDKITDDAEKNKTFNLILNKDDIKL